MSSLTNEEREELEALRLYKLENEGKALTRAFARLEQVMASSHDPIMSIRGFNVIAECLLCLREAIK